MLQKDDFETLADFRKSLRQYLRFVEDGAREGGVTPQQHQVLLAIKGSRGKDWATVGELADSLQIKHHAIVGLIDRCELACLVKRSNSPMDRRIVQVSLTPKGEEIIARLTEKNLPELRTLTGLTRELEALAHSFVEEKPKAKGK
ncbi:MAG TPA: MarR family transcriptional regulator [Fimbriimonadaceae bacterium]|jgi:DNA-binding MarR family transcriptional regulator